MPPGSSYEPTSLVSAFNGIPHIDIDLNTIPDDFEVSLAYFEVSLLLQVDESYDIF